MSGVKGLEDQVKETHDRLEQESAKVFSKLRQMKGTDDVNKIAEHLTELKQVR